MESKKDKKNKKMAVAISMFAHQRCDHHPVPHGHGDAHQGLRALHTDGVRVQTHWEGEKHEA